MTHKSSQKIPIIICLMNSVSGVTSWGLTLRNAFKNHPKYELLLMNLWHNQKSDTFDFNPADIEEAQAIFKQFAPAVIVPNYNWQVLQGLTEKSLGFIGVCHSDSENEYYAPLTKYQGDFAKYISVSPVCTEILKTRLPHRTNDIVTLPCGVEVPDKLERHYQTDPIRLIYGGRIVQEQKRVFDLVDLVEQLQSKEINFILDIVGEGADYAELKERFSAVTGVGNVQFFDKRSPAEMAGVWAEHDIFIQVSNYEGTSVSMLEAMAQGTIPVVTAASSGVTEVIDDGNNGFIVPVGDMQKMADVIENLVANPKSISTIGKAAYKNAKTYSIDSYIAAFTNLVDPVAKTLESARLDPEQFNFWQNKIATANEATTKAQARLEKVEFDRSVEKANYEYQLSQKRASIAQLMNESAELNQRFKNETAELKQQLNNEIIALNHLLSDERATHSNLIEQEQATIQALQQKISDQKGFIQQLEKQRRDATQKLKQELKVESHKAHTLNEQMIQKDVHIDWLQSEVDALNRSTSLRIGRIFYPIKSFSAHLFGRSNRQGDSRE